MDIKNPFIPDQKKKELELIPLHIELIPVLEPLPQKEKEACESDGTMIIEIF